MRMNRKMQLKIPLKGKQDCKMSPDGVSSFFPHDPSFKISKHTSNLALSPHCHRIVQQNDDYSHYKFRQFIYRLHQGWRYDQNLMELVTPSEESCIVRSLCWWIRICGSERKQRRYNLVTVYCQMKCCLPDIGTKELGWITVYTVKYGELCFFTVY